MPKLEKNSYQIITMMKKYDQLVEMNHNLNWPYIPDHLYKILITGSWESRKTKHQQRDINKTYLYVKDPFELKYQLLVNGREKAEIKNLKIQK